jgi:hypothetical protein
LELVGLRLAFSSFLVAARSAPGERPREILIEPQMTRGRVVIHVVEE